MEENNIRQSRIHSLNSILKAINSNLKLQEILDLILDNAIKILHAERGFIVITGIIEGELIFKAGRNIEKNTLESEGMQISRTITQDVIKSGKGIISHNAMSDPRYMQNPSIIHFGLRSVIAVPLVVKEKSVGAIYLDNRFKNGIFNEDDFDFMNIFAHDCAIAMEQARLLDERNYIHEILKRYVSPSVADEILKNGLDIDIKGETREVTILFADIRGFTTLSEITPPHLLLKQLNELFESATSIIFKQRGTLFKYLGDGFMAGWGAPLEDDNHAENALNASIELLNALENLNKSSWAQKGFPMIKMGIGIHSGIATAGIIGSYKRREYSIMGDTVNTAARLEALNKEYSSNLIISEQTLNKTSLAGLFKKIGKTAVRGKKTAITLYKKI